MPANSGTPKDLMGPPDSPEGRLRIRIRDFSVRWDSQGVNIRRAFKEWKGGKKSGQDYDQSSFVGLMDYFVHDYVGPAGGKPILELFHEREALNIPTPPSRPGSSEETGSSGDTQGF